jgi:hypothetical protein
VQLGPFRGGRKGKAGRTRWLDVDELRALHVKRGGSTWCLDALPIADLDALRAEVQALRGEVSEVTELRATVDDLRQRIEKLEKIEASPSRVVQPPSTALPPLARWSERHAVC